MPGTLRSIRASVVVGRTRELDVLADAVHGARSGRAACIVLVGEGGIGKTRLLDETAVVADRVGIARLAGRAPITAPAPFSLIGDALRSWLRTHSVNAPPGPLDRGLALVLPEWPVVSAPADLDPMQRQLLAREGIVHVLREVAEAAGGALLSLDDVHAADPESLETIRYVVNARVNGLTVVAAMRPVESPAADELVRALRRDGLADVITVEPLDERAVDDLVAELLQTRPPSPLVADILARTDGVPLLVEETLRAHVEAGTVQTGDHGAVWRGGAAKVPGTIRDQVAARLDQLDRGDRDVLVAGAVVGDFDPELMRAVVAAGDDRISEALVAGVRVGLLETTGGALAFRHAIIREAVLDASVPHLIDTMHRRAAAALAGPVGVEAASCERRAHHLTAIGAVDEAAAALVAASDEWLRSHALVAAERAAGGAGEAARSPAMRAAAADALALVLVAQGRWSEALDLDEGTVAAHGDTPDRRLRRAGAALDAGRPEVTDVVLALAFAEGDDSPALDLVAGRAALVRGDASSALQRARRAKASAGVDERLAALDLEGRAFDFLGDRPAARASWTQQARDAASAGRTQAQLRAVVQLGKVELFAGEPPRRLREAVELARDAGALVELAWAEENLAIAVAIQGDLQGGLAILEVAIDRCRQLRLDQLAYLLISRAMARSYVVDSFDHDFAEAEAVAGTPDLALHTTGMRGEIALRAGRWDEAIHWFERGAELARAMPGVVPMQSAGWLAWALAAAGRTEEAAAALTEAKAVPDLGRFYSRPVIVAAGEALLAGDAEGVDRAIAAAPGPMPLDVAPMCVVAAHVLGGSNRARWLREALELYESAGATLDADRVRQLLRETGSPVPRRRRVAAPVPAVLAERGVTAREVEVLRLIGEGRSNAEIAEKLYVSVRTVEAHASSLLSKLGARSRGELTARSASIDYGVGDRPAP